MTSNDFMAFILRSPLHGLLSKNMMVVTLTGHKTGRTISFPVSYYCEGQTLWTVTFRTRLWWRNVRTATAVTLRLQERDVAAIAAAAVAEEAVAQQFLNYLTYVPNGAKWLIIHKAAEGEFNADDIKRAEQERMFVKFQLG